MMAWQGFSRLVKDRSGNFGMMTAILLPVLIGAGGLALDVTNMLISKAELQDAADSAALAASTALAAGEAANEAAAEELARQFFLGQASNTMGEEAATALAGALDIDIKTTTTGNGKKFEVQVGSTYDLALSPLMGVLGYGTMNIATSGTSTSGVTAKQPALTMALVLDESGSMHESVGMPGVNKHAALRTAATALFNALDEADPDKKLVRTAVYTYDQRLVWRSAPAWGTSDARETLHKIVDDSYGTTNANEPLQKATDAIKPNAARTDTESKEHAKKDNETVRRYIVFMTDGQMTGTDGKWSKKVDGDVRKKCDSAKKAGLHIYTVALKAPTNGKTLLNYCATSSKDYFEAETMDNLIKAFETIAKDAAKETTRLTN
ncbi:TadE/TadG family protein [Pseudorhizobium endolithicum]|uniref:TadE/TadG family protein n=1 Tax=Pseudorhizobium endolithicum TaxID=1191678 RepID=A0ABN7JPR0_9HYPH|nr:TadE/TadG family type IV pilus assembly protein [Pseudorhizobium endolithicum]CAD7040758.1 TadE/TadG family protein [Pseudorhizobium endolithicum]